MSEPKDGAPSSEELLLKPNERVIRGLCAIVHQLMLLGLFAEAIKLANMTLGLDRDCVQVLILKAECFAELSKKNV